MKRDEEKERESFAEVKEEKRVKTRRRTMGLSHKAERSFILKNEKERRKFELSTYLTYVTKAFTLS